VKHAILVGLICVMAMLARAGPNDYFPGPDDVLTIHVADHQELSVEQAVVSRAGTITHPVWGEVRAEGMSLAELEDALRRRLAGDFIKDPRVTVTVLQANTLLVYLLGEYGVTNAYKLGINGRLSELIVRSASTPELCKRMMAVILRRETRQTTIETPADRISEAETGGAQSEAQPAAADPPHRATRAVEVMASTTVDLYDLMVLGRKEIDVPLRRNDWVRLVRRDPERNESYVFLVGNEGIRTGAYRFAPGMTAADVIGAAGKQGEPKAAADDGQDEEVVPGQFLVLGNWPASADQVAAFGEVNKPGVQELSPGVMLGDALVKAGLSHNAGSLARIVLARRRKKGVKARLYYMMNTSPEDHYGLKERLQGGDIVFVISDRAGLHD